MERWVDFRGKMESMKGGGLWFHKRGEIEKIKREIVRHYTRGGNR